MRRAFTLVLALSACSASPNASPHLAPASVEHPVAESDLTVVRLTEEAVRRLDLQVSEVSSTRAWRSDALAVKSSSRPDACSR